MFEGPPSKMAGFDLESYRPMPVIYQLRYSILKKIEDNEEVLPDIDGREEAKSDVIRAILSGAHPYLVSEEGTGKTRLARSLTRLLPPIITIKGCPYRDDPKWPREWLCPRCREAEDPAEKYGIEFIPGSRRFSRIQGNEYTNEAKLLGLKDIQAIAQGKSPSDPSVFTGTGVFRANRGILFIDELPAIRTKVQVLLHPILEERKAILEEYNWERYIDILLIATGNPMGFAHVNEVPRPLLDRMETIYMNLPKEDVEKEILLKERFVVDSNNFFTERGFGQKNLLSPYLNLGEEISRKVIAPWWIIDVVNKTVRYSRECPNLEKKASIRGVYKGIDHTYASVEMSGRTVARLEDAYLGLRLALRGRIRLRPEFVVFDDPGKTFERTDAVVEDMMLYAVNAVGNEIYRGIREIFEKEEFADELTSLLSDGTENLTEKLLEFPHIEKSVGWMKAVSLEKINKDLLNEVEKKFFHNEGDTNVLEEYNYSALEAIVNTAIHKTDLRKREIINESLAKGKVFFPQKLVL